MKRNFTDWLSTFRDSIATYSYYIDFEKVYGNVENIKQDLQPQTKIKDLRGEQLGIYDKIHSGHKIPDKEREF